MRRLRAPAGRRLQPTITLFRHRSTMRSTSQRWLPRLTLLRRAHSFGPCRTSTPCSTHVDARGDEGGGVGIQQPHNRRRPSTSGSTMDHTPRRRPTYPPWSLSRATATGFGRCRPPDLLENSRQYPPRITGTTFRAPDVSGCIPDQRIILRMELDGGRPGAQELIARTRSAPSSRLRDSRPSGRG